MYVHVSQKMERCDWDEPMLYMMSPINLFIAKIINCLLIGKFLANFIELCALKIIYWAFFGVRNISLYVENQNNDVVKLIIGIYSNGR